MCGTWFSALDGVATMPAHVISFENDALGNLTAQGKAVIYANVDRSQLLVCGRLHDTDPPSSTRYGQLPLIGFSSRGPCLPLDFRMRSDIHRRFPHRHGLKRIAQSIGRRCGQQRVLLGRRGKRDSRDIEEGRRIEVDGPQSDMSGSNGQIRGTLRVS